jgi:hypothetical protein
LPRALTVTDTTADASAVGGGVDHAVVHRVVGIDVPAEETGVEIL